MSWQVYLFGATICSWKQATGDEVLYVRPDAVFDKSKPISGGGQTQPAAVHWQRLSCRKPHFHPCTYLQHLQFMIRAQQLVSSSDGPGSLQQACSASPLQLYLASPQLRRHCSMTLYSQPPEVAICPQHMPTADAQPALIGCCVMCRCSPLLPSVWSWSNAATRLCKEPRLAGQWLTRQQQRAAEAVTGA